MVSLSSSCGSSGADGLVQAAPSKGSRDSGFGTGRKRQAAMPPSITDERLRTWHWIAIDRLVPKAQSIPDLAEGVHQILDQLIDMKGCRRDPKPLCAAWNSRIVDRLDIDGELFQ